jgi:hypothetical protein
VDEVQGFVSQRHRDLGIAALAAPELDSLFQDAARLNHGSAWFAHIPFAHWIVGAARPRVLVELGSHAGISYAAFCSAVLASGTGTRCYAVDTWRGDEQAGHYDETVFADLSRYHEQHFVAFSQLLRCTFDEAAGQFADGTIDLLHIDGLHTYEAIRHDFETWRPKLSDRAVVLFHDTNERLKGFGVWQLWAELTRRWPGFEFVHGHGLGVLCVGAEAPEPVRDICALGGEEVARLRMRFAFLGARWDAERRAGRLAREVELRDGRIAGLEEARTAAAAQAKEAEMSLAALRTEAAQATSRHADAEAAPITLRDTVQEARAAASSAEHVSAMSAEAAELAGRRAHDFAHRAAKAEREARDARDFAHRAAKAEREARDARDFARLAEQAAQERDRLLHSTSWRITAPLRVVGRWLT